MSKSKVTHDTFTLERTVNAPADRVFEALANPEQKAKWFAGGAAWKEGERRFEFKIGGREHVAGEHEGGMTSVFDAIYLDIVTNERVVYAYDMTVNGRKLSTSLTTFEIVSKGNQSKIILTEQGAYYDDPETTQLAPEGQAQSRKRGTEELMNRLAALFTN